MDMEALLCGVTRNLAHVRRYSSAPVIRAENVAEHSFYVAYYALNVALDLQKFYEINIENVVTRAILHDIGEAVTGDIMRPFKYATTSIHEAIVEAENMLVAERLDGYIYDTWLNAKDKTIEGQIVAFADVLCVVAYCYEEWMFGNRHVRQIILDASGYIKSFTDQEMFSHYRGSLMRLLRLIKEGEFREDHGCKC